MTPTRRLALAVSAALVALPASFPAPLALAGDVLPGEKTELTPEVRTEAEGHLKTIREGKGEAVDKARLALLRMGPVIWPVVENAIHLTVTDAPKPHLNYLKALLAPKTEPEFEWLRDRLRRATLIGRPEAFLTEIYAFRTGLPDPKHPSQHVPPKCPSSPLPTGGVVFRSSDKTIVIAFGADAMPPKDPKEKFHPDGGDVLLEDSAAGWAASVGGKPVTGPRISGKGGNAVTRSPQGYAFAWAQNGAVGAKPGGQGGDSGIAEAVGGVGQFKHDGAAGAGGGG